MDNVKKIEDFLDRMQGLIDEAWDIAMYADQVAWDESIKNGTLFSEDLY